MKIIIKKEDEEKEQYKNEILDYIFVLFFNVDHSVLRLKLEKNEYRKCKQENLQCWRKTPIWLNFFSFKFNSIICNNANTILNKLTTKK